MSDYDICETGLWVDGDGNVVTSAPDGPGTLLVPPGGTMRPERVRAVEAARAAAPVVVEESVTDPEPEGEAKPAKARAAKKAG
jgi:hypothetical protein